MSMKVVIKTIGKGSAEIKDFEPGKKYYIDLGAKSVYDCPVTDEQGNVIGVIPDKTALALIQNGEKSGIMTKETVSNYMADKGLQKLELKSVEVSAFMYIVCDSVEESAKSRAKKTAAAVASFEYEYDEALTDSQKAAVKERVEWLQKVGVGYASKHGEDCLKSIIQAFINRMAELVRGGRTEIEAFAPTYVSSDTEGEVIMALRHVLLGKHILLVGTAGCGKNTLVNTFINLFSMSDSNYNASINRYTSKEDLVCSMSAKDGTTKVNLSELLEIGQRGGVLVFDEVNMAAPDVMTVFNSLLDDRRTIYVSGVGMVTLSPDTIIFATMNESNDYEIYEGTNDISAAFRSRFQVMYMDLTKDKVRGVFERKCVCRGKALDKKQIDQMTKIYMELFGRVYNTANDTEPLPVQAVDLRTWITAGQNVAAGFENSVRSAVMSTVAQTLTSERDREIVSQIIPLLVL